MFPASVFGGHHCSVAGPASSLSSHTTLLMASDSLHLGCIFLSSVAFLYGLSLLLAPTELAPCPSRSGRSHPNFWHGATLLLAEHDWWLEHTGLPNGNQYQLCTPTPPQKPIQNHPLPVELMFHFSYSLGQVSVYSLPSEIKIPLDSSKTKSVISITTMSNMGRRGVNL